jgi:hypothetical protein
MTESIAVDLLSTADLAERSGATMRQLDRWAAALVFGTRYSEPGSGNRRAFDSADVVIARALVELGHLVGHVPTPMAVTIGAAIRRHDAGRWLLVCHDDAVVCDRLPISTEVAGVALLVDLEVLDRG